LSGDPCPEDVTEQRCRPLFCT